MGAQKNRRLPGRPSFTTTKESFEAFLQEVNIRSYRKYNCILTSRPGNEAIAIELDILTKKKLTLRSIIPFLIWEMFYKGDKENSVTIYDWIIDNYDALISRDSV